MLSRLFCVAFAGHLASHRPALVGYESSCRRLQVPLLSTVPRVTQLHASPLERYYRARCAQLGTSEIPHWGCGTTISICARNSPDGTFSHRPANSRLVSTNGFKPRFVQNGVPIEHQVAIEDTEDFDPRFRRPRLWLGSRHRLCQGWKYAKAPITSAQKHSSP